MTVTVDGVPLEEPLPDTRGLAHSHPQFRESAARLTNQPPKVVGPVGLLYVQQREMAVTVPHDKNVNILGSEDATTCIILVLRHTRAEFWEVPHAPPSAVSPESNQGRLTKSSRSTYAQDIIGDTGHCEDSHCYAFITGHDATAVLVSEEDYRDEWCSAMSVLGDQGGWKASGAVGLAHCDGAGTEEGLMSLVSRIQELALGYPEGRLQLHLVGGYLDPNNYAEELFYNILQVFHKQPIEIELITACVGDLNTVVRNGIHWPIIYGVGINIKTGELFPATFQDKGPEQSLRAARQLSSSNSQPTILDVYDCGLGLLRIGPFSYHPLRGVDLWLEQSDDIILQHLSTSPQVEPPHFTMQIRAALKYIQENPFPAVTVFRENRPHYYRRDELTGFWIPFSY